MNDGNPLFECATFLFLGPVLDDLDDFTDKGIFTFRGTWPQIILSETKLLTFLSSGEAVSKDRTVVQILKFARFNGQRCQARMVEKEETGNKFLEVDLIPDNPYFLVFEK